MNGIRYGKHSDVEGKPYGGLAVIVPLLKRMGVEEIIDQPLPVDDQAEFWALIAESASSTDNPVRVVLETDRIVRPICGSAGNGSLSSTP